MTTFGRLAGQGSAGPRRHVVECAPPCAFKSIRTADTAEDARKKPCPRCAGTLR